MKKSGIMLIVVLLTLFASFTSFAEDANEKNTTDEDEMEIIEEMMNEWETNGYPDIVGYVNYDNNIGKFNIGLIDADESDINEIKLKLATSENVNFETATYSYNDLLNVQDKISKEADETQSIYGVGIGWTTIDGEVTGFGDSGHENRVVVTVDKSVYDEFVDKYQSEYGDTVFVEAGSAGAEDTMAEQTENNIWLYMIFFIMLCVVMLGLFLIKRNRLVMVKQTANGGLVAESRPLRRNEVILAVKESKVVPSDDVYKAILEKVKKQE